MATVTPRRNLTLRLALLAALAVGAILSLLVVGLPQVRGQTPPLTDDEAALLALINDYRVQNGLSPLGVSPTLTTAARWMSEDMAEHNYLGHIDSLGRNPSERMAAFGYAAAACEARSSVAGAARRKAPSRPGATRRCTTRSMLTSGFRGGRRWEGRQPRVDYGWYWTVDFGDYDDSDGSWPTPTSTSTPTPSPTPSPSPTPTPPTPTPAPTLHRRRRRQRRG